MSSYLQAPKCRMTSNMNAPSTPRRACEACNRKKTKCDMRQPCCSLCERTGQQCTFPTRRKRRRPNRVVCSTSRSRMGTESQDRILDILAAHYRDGGASASLDLVALGGGKIPTPTQGVFSSQRDALDPFSAPELSLAQPSLLVEQHNWEDTQVLDDQEHEQFQPYGTTALELPGGIPEDFTTSQATGGHKQSSGHDTEAGYSPSSTDSYPCPDLPHSVMERLIELFFSRIQGWLPLLHKTCFYAKHRDPRTGQLHNLKDIPPIQAFTLWGMCGLAARFCDMDIFSEIPRVERGDQFVFMASALYAQLRPTIITPSLEYIQGCILLAFNYYTSCLCHRGWMITGSCVRLAYELDLHITDKDGGHNLESSEWVIREEKRRAWWLIWQLDRFGSNMTSRPYAIDNRVMSVLLPASDSDWLREIPVKSTTLDTNPEPVWRNMRQTENQNPWIWFIACDYLMSLVHEQIYRETPSEEDIQRWKTVSSCFRLALPPEFCLNPDTSIYDIGNFDKANWAISTHLLLLFLESELDYAMAEVTSCPTMTNGVVAQRIRLCMGSWLPEHLQVSHPFVGCSLLGPKAVYFTTGLDQTVERQWALTREILSLVLSHISRYWKLGCVLQEVEHLIQSKEALPGRIPSSAKRLNALLPVCKEGPDKKSAEDSMPENGRSTGNLSHRSLRAEDEMLRYSSDLEIGAFSIYPTGLSPATLSHPQAVESPPISAQDC